jgi:hypothetical protein
MTAINVAFSATQEPDPIPGLPNRSRVAVTVADSGFHSAIVPSQPGMVPGEMKALDRKPIGNSRVCAMVVASLRSTSPRYTPTQISANRSNRMSAIPAQKAPPVPCTRQPIARPANSGAQVVELAEHHEVLVTAQDLVHGGVLPDQADPVTDLFGLPFDVEPGDGRPPAVQLQQCREDPHRGGLAGAVRAEQPAHRCLGYGQVEPVQRVLVAVALAEAFRRHGERARCHVHPLQVSSAPPVGR